MSFFGLLRFFLHREEDLRDLLTDKEHSSFCLFHMQYDFFISVTRLIHMCDMTHSYAWHDSFVCVTWLILYMWHNPFRRLKISAISSLITSAIFVFKWVLLRLWMRDIVSTNELHHSCTTQIHASYWHLTIDSKSTKNPRYQCAILTPSYVLDSFICVAWLSICMTWFIHICDMTHSHVWHDPFRRLKIFAISWLIKNARNFVSVSCVWLLHKCDTTHSYVRHGSFVCVTWLIHICDITHSGGWRSSRSPHW